MASAYTTETFTSEVAVAMYDHDPDGTSAAVVTPDAGTTERWVDLRDFTEFTALAMSSTLTGNGISKLEIVAADDTSGTNITVIKDSGAVVCDAVGDYVVESCTSAEIGYLSAASGYDLRYVAARLTVANSADEAVVTYIRSGALHKESGLTADAIS